MDGSPPPFLLYSSDLLIFPIQEQEVLLPSELLCNDLGIHTLL